MTVQAATLASCTVEGVAEGAVSASRLSASIVEGSGSLLLASRLTANVVEGSPNPISTSSLALYVVEGPPDTRRRRQSSIT